MMINQRFGYQNQQQKLMQPQRVFSTGPNGRRKDLPKDKPYDGYGSQNHNSITMPSQVK